jgi:hypothetical protein
MIRTLLQYFTQRCLDNGPRSPGWLRWLQERDPSLREYAAETKELDFLLRKSARNVREEFLQEKAVSRPVLQAERRAKDVNRSAPRLGWLAAVAAALAGVLAFNHYSIQQANAEHAKFLSTQLASVPNEMLGVLAQAARSSRDYSPLAQLTLPEVNVWSDIPRGTQGQLKESFSVWGTQLSDLGTRVYERLDVRTELN